MEGAPARSEAFRALSRDRSLPKSFRDWAGVYRVPDHGEGRLAVVQGVADLRSLRARFPAQAAAPGPFLEELEARAAAMGCPVPTDDEGAAIALERALLGGWAERTDGALVRAFLHASEAERPRLTPLPEVVPGGFMVPEFYAVPRPDGPKPRVFTLGALLDQGPSPWERYASHHGDPLRPRLEIVRKVVSAKDRPRAWGARWAAEHHFAFFDHEPLSFTARAWGDLRVAESGTGHYMDWYCG